MHLTVVPSYVDPEADIYPSATLLNKVLKTHLPRDQTGSTSTWALGDKSAVGKSNQGTSPCALRAQPLERVLDWWRKNSRAVWAGARKQEFINAKVHTQGGSAGVLESWASTALWFWLKGLTNYGVNLHGNGVGYLSDGLGCTWLVR